MTKEARAAILLTLILGVVVAGLALSPVSVPMPVDNVDKLYHAVAFTGLSVPVSFLAPRLIPVTVIVLAVFGGVIEVIQPYVGRECSLRDWVANVAGIAIGVIMGRTTAGMVCGSQALAFRMAQSAKQGDGRRRGQ